MNNFKILLKYLKRSLKSVIFSLICCLFFVPATLLIPFFTGKCIDVFTETMKQVNPDYSLMLQNELRYLFIICGLIIVVVVFQYIFESFVNIFIERTIVYLRNDLYQKINNVSISFIDSHLHGDLVSRLINDVDNVSTALISGYKQFYQGVITIIFVLSFMFWQNWLLALIVIVFTPLSFLLSYIISKKSHIYFKKQAKEVGDLGAKTLEDFENIDIIKSFNYRDESFKKFKEVNDSLYKVGRKAQFLSSLTNPATRLINNSIYAIVGVVGAILVVYGNNINIGISLTVGGITTFLQYASQFAKPLNEISSCLSEIQTGLASLKRINEIFEYNDDIDNGVIEVKEEINSLMLKDVMFGYEKDKIIFKDIDFEVKKGQKVAIVGPTGCGKTTIINLLLRFYDPLNGEINVNNINTLDIKKDNLRNHFGMVLQDSWIFHGTVLENITYGKQNATMDEVIKTCKSANCYDLIMRLPQGFDTLISDDEGLSKGEKQLICIARVMLTSPDFLILDEATSNVDTRTEANIGKALDRLMKHKTSIVIAHRLSTIKTSDLILVLKDGKIIEKGNHNELLLEKGFYYNLFNSQYR